MASIYDEYLPHAFPIRVKLMRHQVNRRVNALSRADRTDVPNLSSFAVSTDPTSDFNWLWLSQVSFNFLVANNWLRPDDMELTKELLDWE